jgi:hypothetical protein
MTKSFFIAACLILPVAAMAADVKAPAAGTPAAPAASSALDAHAAARASKIQSTKSGACRQEVADRGLSGVEYKTAFVECMKK